MDAEFLQLAREAVVALQQPNWAEVAGLIVSAVVGFGQIGQALERQGEVLADLLRRSA